MKSFEQYLLERNEDGRKDIQDKVFGKKWSELKKEKSKASDPSYHLPGVGRFKDEAQARKAYPDHGRFKESMDDICRCCGQTPCNCTHIDEVRKTTQTGQRGMKMVNLAVKAHTNTAVRKHNNRSLAKDQAALLIKKQTRGLRYNWDATETAAMKAKLDAVSQIKAHIKANKE